MLGAALGLTVGILVDGVFVGCPLGELVVTVTEMVTFKVAAPGVSVKKGINSVRLSVFVASSYPFWRVITKLPSATELINSFFTSSSS